MLAKADANVRMLTCQRRQRERSTMGADHTNRHHFIANSYLIPIPHPGHQPEAHNIFEPISLKETMAEWRQQRKDSKSEL